MQDLLGWVSLVVAVIAVVIAIWQGTLSKQQLRLAQDTTAATDDALKEIRDLARDNERTVKEIKSSIDERITRILDARLEAERQELKSKAQRDEDGAAIAKSALKGFGQLFMESMKESQRRAQGGPTDPPELAADHSQSDSP